MSKKEESKDNALSSEVVPEAKQIEYKSSRFSVGFHVLLPVAGLILVAFGRKQIFEKLINQIDKRCLTVLCPRFIKKEALLKWASGRLPPTWSSHYTKTLSGGIEDLWRDGSLLCTLINASIPGACPNPHRHWKKPPVHAQAMAYKYFGVIPIFSNEDLQKALSSQLERKFIKYLSEIQISMNKIAENNEKEKKITERYIVRGMGVFSGEQYKMAEFYVYLDENCDDDNESNIIIQIRGPFGSFGEAISPKLINRKRKFTRKIKSRRRSSIKLIENLQSFQWNFSRSQKKVPSEEIDVEATLENDRIKVCYIPKNYGMYEINMIAGGELIKGCPFNVHIFVNEKNESEVTLKSLRHSRTVRKVIDSSEEKMSSTISQAIQEEIFEEKQLIHKSSFNFKEVVDEITKHGTIFEGLIDDKNNNCERKLEVTTKDTDSLNGTEICDPISGGSNIFESSGKGNYNKCETETPITNINENKSDVLVNEPVILPVDMEPNLKNSTQKNVDPVEITPSKLTEENNNIADSFSTFILNEIYLKEDQTCFNNSLERNTGRRDMNENKTDTDNNIESGVKVKNTYTNIINQNGNIRNNNHIKDLIELKHNVNKELLAKNNEKIDETKDTLIQNNAYTKNTYNNISPVTNHIFKEKGKIIDKQINDKPNLIVDETNNLDKDVLTNNETKENDEKTKSNYQSNIVFASSHFKAQNRVLQLKHSFENKYIPKEKSNSDKSRETKLPNKSMSNKFDKLNVTNNIFESQVEETKIKNTVMYGANKVSKPKEYEEKGRNQENELASRIQKFFGKTSSNIDTESYSDTEIPSNNVIPHEENEKIQESELASRIQTFFGKNSSNADKDTYSDIEVSSNNVTPHEENQQNQENELASRIQKFFGKTSSTIKETYSDIEIPDKNKSNNVTPLANHANDYVLNKQFAKFKANNNESKPIFVNKQQVAAIDKKQLDHNNCTSYVCQPRYMENVNVNKIKIPERFIDPPTKNCMYRLDDKYFKNILNESNKVTQKTNTREELDKKESCDNSIKNKSPNDCIESCDKYEMNNNSIKQRIQMYLETNSVPNNFKIVTKDTSPICLDHIVPEVEGFPKTVAERRKIFAQSSLGSESNSKNSSFSENESSLGSSIKKFKIEDLTFLNALNDSVVSPNEDWSLCSTVSMPNLSIESEWSPMSSVKDKKFFWENVSSRSSSSISNKSLSPNKMKKTFSELERSKLIWKKPDESISVKETFKENVTSSGNMLGKSADDILSMTESLAHQHNKKYQSVDDSLNKCTVLSIEERKKMLLKQAYVHEKTNKEKIKQMKKMVYKPDLKDVSQEKVKETVTFSPISEKIKRYNSVVQLPTQEKKLPKSTQIRKAKSFHIRTTTKQTEESDKSSIGHFKQTIKYFKNLEKQSQTVKVKLPSTSSHLENISPTVRYRTGSLNLPKVSDKFSVHNLYDDVFGHNHSFKGTPNRSALVEALATLTRNPSKYDMSEKAEDDIQYDLFKHVKRRRRKSLKSIFDIYY
ncbi:uncharacterized protein MAL13P1.304 isoform X2 [Diabrotica virgifera virgifera]|uniref:Uncharacterized protein MAL13P1.304-like isoform X2 n=1 Tax=Diabrotica virgifera virgifera TaxID=50390 RepID=A0A6P7FDP5_DIAVI|nr:uncharacterized protein MAL13P1.304 isoform X2 [Diabrotica virgifera virgifera]